MDESLITGRYAKALLEYSQNVGMDKQVYRNMKNITKNFYNFPEIIKVLENPVISIEDKRKLIITAADDDNVCDALLRFIDLLFKNKRESNIYLIALKFRDMYREHNNIYFGKLTTASRWKNGSMEKLKQIILNGRDGTVEFHEVVDPSIIGGFIIEYDCLLIDASIAGQIKQINKELIERNRRIV